jgi:hypothetical protein
MVPDHLIDNEPQELLAEIRIKMGIFGQRPQTGNLRFFAGRV